MILILGICYWFEKDALRKLRKNNTCVIYVRSTFSNKPSYYFTSQIMIVTADDAVTLT